MTEIAATKLAAPPEASASAVLFDVALTITVPSPAPPAVISMSVTAPVLPTRVPRKASTVLPTVAAERAADTPAPEPIATTTVLEVAVSVDVAITSSSPAVTVAD